MGKRRLHSRRRVRDNKRRIKSRKYQISKRMGGSPRNKGDVSPPTIAWDVRQPEVAAHHRGLTAVTNVTIAAAAATGAGQHNKSRREIAERILSLGATQAFLQLVSLIVALFGIVSATASLAPFFLVFGIVLALLGLILQVCIYCKTRNYKKTELVESSKTLNKLTKICTIISFIVTSTGFILSLGIVVGGLILLGVLASVILIAFLYNFLTKGKESASMPQQATDAARAMGGGKRIFGGSLNDVNIKFQGLLDELSKDEELKPECLELLMIESHTGEITVDLLCDAVDADNFDLVACIKKIGEKIGKKITEKTKGTESTSSRVSESPEIEKTLKDFRPKQTLKNGIFSLVEGRLIKKWDLPHIFSSIGHGITYNENELPFLSHDDLSKRGWVSGGYTKKRRKTRKRINRRKTRKRTNRRKTKKRKSRRKTNKKKKNYS